MAKTGRRVSGTAGPRDRVWFTHPEMQQRIAEARADITAGRTSSVTTAKDVRDHLARLKKRRRRG
jgi:hypothetical protein